MNPKKLHTSIGSYNLQIQYIIPKISKKANVLNESLKNIHLAKNQVQV